MSNKSVEKFTESRFFSTNSLDESDIVFIERNQGYNTLQFYTCDISPEDGTEHFVGGLQDNGTWKGPSTYEASTSWEAEGKYPYERIGGGDGMQVQIDRRNSDIIYVGSQFGYYNRINLETGDREFIRPSHTLGEEPYRFNWETPILLSSQPKFHRMMWRSR